VLNGTKRYITNAPEAGIFTVMARTAHETGYGVEQDVQCFLVPDHVRSVSASDEFARAGNGRLHRAGNSPGFACSGAAATR
jgi:alkylation response protein AidB-like acyl-CoA dehydrogenase